ncbi:unnamed protein product [Brassica oleracea var. botrytis]|uniref:Zinc finger PHD-type domain-containing protein n=3 Tax=Brassica TaxID=3705 RepID=A0A8X7UAA4_BRACI|nr:uncharacterized protein LOC106440603 [Brassica napus]XP_048613098.1 uncharacterized protein LOC106440603 [Brassica napus]XP_048613099.1 uncharacterized protein LOC106440603 [Brassica napus]XP_048613100.1 uncharacterized protein LOC106440603 [Brassica napus]XP_048613101.1 uncharacterized protein LOC106440603 [Brassica napus]KAG2272085.1 hypothetical protein Bca52824_066640 [Brassica carinata]
MENLITTFGPKHSLEKSGPHSTQYYEKRCYICVICKTWISYESSCFYCRLCDFCFHKECQTALMESNPTIDHPETHEHTLTFIRKKNSFSCDACGLVGEFEINMYGCLPCNFFIHRDCIYLPKIIKLTRHSHRLLHTYHVPDCNTKCRICNGSFVWGCGGYICTDKTCDYKLHSYCATRKATWDGRDLEQELEEISNSDQDVTSLKEVDGKTFRHFSHHHDLMKLCVNGEKEGDERVCEACILPIGSGSFLGCKECDFALHATCANLPRKLEHTFHRHPLTLEVDIIEEGFFSCSQCERESCGFMYRCCQEECEFKMDAKCASLADPLYNGAHQHPLTLLDSGACCYECDLYFDSTRATLPVLVKCNYDMHPLSLCFTQSFIWYKPSLSCDACEKGINPDVQDIYVCFDCNTVVHVECAIGKYPYLKHGHTIELNGFEIEIASNNNISRPICHACHSICQDKLFFRNKKNVTISFCSINCVTTSS